MPSVRTGRIRIDCIVENAGGSAWTSGSAPQEAGAEHGRASSPEFVLLGYQVFDAETGLHVMEGSASAWAAIASRAGSWKSAPRFSCRRKKAVTVSGYRRFRETLGSEDLGSEFLAIEVMSGAADVAVQSVRRTTRAGCAGGARCSWGIERCGIPGAPFSATVR